jgi:hypothetical protein|tara:strand:- start:103 stop:426 length:324 start_codon:yes stop_codon:yes gene_type:complete
MTDKKDDNKDVVVNLFKDKSEHIMTTAAVNQMPQDNFTKLVLDHLDVIKEDTEKFKATGMITILFDDKGPIVDYFAGSVNLNSAYVLMDQLKSVILEKIEQAQEGTE